MCEIGPAGYYGEKALVEVISPPFLREMISTTPFFRDRSRSGKEPFVKGVLTLCHFTFISSSAPYGVLYYA